MKRLRSWASRCLKERIDSPSKRRVISDCTLTGSAEGLQDNRIEMRRFAGKFSPMSLIVNDHSRWLTWTLAVLLSLGTTWVSENFWSYAGDGKTHTMLPLAAVFISAVIGGYTPGAISLVITGLLLSYLLAPVEALGIERRADQIWFAIYVLLAIGALWLGAALKSALRNGKLASDRLEKEVDRRTNELKSKNQELQRLIADIDEARRFLDSLIDNIPLVIYVKSADDLRLLRINREARLTIEDLSSQIGKTAFDVLPRDVAERVSAVDQQALASHSVIEFEETIPTTRLGKRTFSVKKVPLFDRLGKAAYILSIAEDITDKKRAQEQRLKLAYEQAAREEAERKKGELEDAVQARDTFLSICSHELKTPLTTLKMQAGVVRMLFEKGDFETLRKPKIRQLVMDTDKEINRINRLINDMLDVSRIRTGRLSLHLGTVNLTEVVHEVVEHFRSDPAYKDIEIKETLPPNISGTWDRNRIEQVVINLVSNALKYGNQKPVSVSIDSEGSAVRIIVEDQGPGISPKDQKRIFQRFERAAASDSITGLGLGLYIVHEIVNLHGGTIKIQSEPQKGSRFMVELPRKAFSAQAA